MSEQVPIRALLNNSGLQVPEDRIATQEGYCTALLGLISQVRGQDYGETPPATPFTASWS